MAEIKGFWAFFWAFYLGFFFWAFYLRPISSSHFVFVLTHRCAAPSSSSHTAALRCAVFLCLGSSSSHTAALRRLPLPWVFVLTLSHTAALRPSLRYFLPLRGCALLPLPRSTPARIAHSGNLSSLQLTALENMHYSYMMRFDNAEEARRTKSLIDKLQQSKDVVIQPEGFLGDCCSETKTELDNLSTADMSDGSFSPKIHNLNAAGVKSYDTNDESDENVTLISLLQFKKGTKKQRPTGGTAPIASSRPCGSPARSISRSCGSLTVNRKRIRVILSDDEDDKDENGCSDRIAGGSLVEGIATSDELSKKHASSPYPEVQDVSPVASRCTVDASARSNLQNSTSTHKSRSSNKYNGSDSRVTGTCAHVGDSNTHGNSGSSNLLRNEMPAVAHGCYDESCQRIMFKIDQELVYMDPNMYGVGGKLNIEQMKVDLACFYYLKLPQEKRSRGVPVIQHMKCGGKILESMETLYSFKDHAPENTWMRFLLVLWCRNM